MTPTFVSPVAKEDLEPILQYLSEHNLGINKYRKKVGEGISQTLGIVSKRCLAPDISRHTWLHPKLFYFLQEFGKKYVMPHISYTSIQVNVNFSCKKHKDVNNVGNSYIVAFGDFVGGDLTIEDKRYDIKEKGLLFNGSELEHCTEPFLGNRISIVYHSLMPISRWGTMIPQIANFESFLDEGGQWKLRRLSDGKILDKKNPLPHPLLKRQLLPSIQ